MVDKYSYVYLGGSCLRWERADPSHRVPPSFLPTSGATEHDRTLVVTKQRSEWEGIVKIQKTATQKFRDYSDTYGTTAPPPDPEVYFDDESFLPICC